MYIMTIFINIIAKNLLTLFINEINIIHDEYFFLAYDRTCRLAKGLDFGAIIGNPLFF